MNKPVGTERAYFGYEKRLEERIQRLETSVERLCTVLARIDNQSSRQKWPHYTANDIELIRQYVRGDLEPRGPA